MTLFLWYHNSFHYKTQSPFRLTLCHKMHLGEIKKGEDKNAVSSQSDDMWNTVFCFQ